VEQEEEKIAGVITEAALEAADTVSWIAIATQRKMLQR
jgi:hypothetical protein